MSLMCVDNLGKAYRTYSSEWLRFARWFGLPTKPSEENWVIRHVRFDVHHGEAIGIIGQNGAGKSTLLKMITGVLQPTEGSIQVNGRISAILELGMGFNPELTGRQNVFHAAGLMGLSTEQLNQAMPEIEAFIEIGEYFDEPLRTYSSGMQMRVAFAVVTAYRPDILIIDEALSVGDTYFQHKSFSRIKEFQDQGTTLLIVSHDPGAIKLLCDRVILLDNGVVAKEGNSEEILDYYNALIAQKENSTVEVKRLGSGKTQTVSGTGEAKVLETIIYNSKGEQAKHIGVGEQVELRIKVKVYKDIESLVLGYGIKDRLGQVMYGTNTWHTKQAIASPRAGEEFQFKISFAANFGVGSYSIQTALVDQDTHLTANYEWRDLALFFNVVNFNKKVFVGCLWNEPQIIIERLNE